MMGQKKIEHIKQYREIGPQVLEQLKDIMRPIDERKEYTRYWERMRKEVAR